jgi:COMPASS component SWD3
MLFSNLEYENKKLKLRVDQVDRENRELKRSLYELSARHNMLVAQIRSRDGAGLDADALLAGVEELAAEDIEQAESAWESGKVVGASPPSKTIAARQGAGGGAGGRDGGEASNGPFQYKYDLRGHTGPVYIVQFSPSGQLVASGGFDHTVRVWDIQRPARQEEVHCLAEHSLNVSDVAWSSDSSTLLSGSYDQTVRAWSVGTGQSTGSWRVSPKGAFVQKVAFRPASESQVILVATTQKHVLAYDRRAPAADAGAQQPIFTLENDTMVNTLACYRDGVHVLSGDKHGVVKYWDLRTLKEVESARVLNGEQGKPISHIEISAPIEDGVAERADGTPDDGRYVAVNSYDNVLRVYERAAAGARSSRLELVHALKGHQNKNWPIRCSWYVGKNFHRARPLLRRPTPHDFADRTDEQAGDEGGAGADERKQPPPLFGSVNGGSGSAGNGGSGGGGGGVVVASGGGVAGGALEEGWGSRSVHDAMLLASGSADGRAYIFDVGGARGAKLVQRLEGHTDRVHGVSFHPQDPLLATCSADCSIKIWGAKSDRHRNG